MGDRKMGEQKNEKSTEVAAGEAGGNMPSGRIVVLYLHEQKGYRQCLCMRIATRRRLEDEKGGGNACGDAGELQSNMPIRRTAVGRFQESKEHVQYLGVST